MTTTQKAELRNLRKEWLHILKTETITNAHVRHYNEDVAYVKLNFRGWDNLIQH